MKHLWGDSKPRAPSTVTPEDVYAKWQQLVAKAEQAIECHERNKVNRLRKEEMRLGPHEQLRHPNEIEFLIEDSKRLKWGDK